VSALFYHFFLIMNKIFYKNVNTSKYLEISASFIKITYMPV